MKPVLLVALLALSVSSSSANWPQFRGPHGDGIAPAPADPPVEWSEEKNIAWKTPVHGKAWSSPVIHGDQVWMTTATEDGRELFAICLDRRTGEVLLDRKLFDVADPQFCHKFNSYASPTPVIEDGRVYLTFGSPGTACLDTETFEVLWTRTDFVCNHFRGAGSSPVLHENLLIMNFDGSDFQYVVGLDKRTGDTVWRTDRSIDFMDLQPDGKPEAEGDLRKAFSTPHVATIAGKPTLLSVGAKALYGYEPTTGEERFRVESRVGHSSSVRPAWDGERVYYTTGYSRGELWAVEPAADGGASDEDIVWKLKRSVPNKPSPIHYRGRIYMVDDGGIASCVNPETGELIWNERVGGNYSASPIIANGRFYCFNEEGKATVLATGDEYRVLAVNELSDGFMAMPAVDGDALILRSKTHVYRVERE